MSELRSYLRAHVEQLSEEAKQTISDDMHGETHPACRQTLRDLIEFEHFPFNQAFFRLEEAKAALVIKGYDKVSDVLITEELKKAGFIGELRGQCRIQGRKSPKKSLSYWAHQRSKFAKASGGERYAMIQAAYV